MTIITAPVGERPPEILEDGNGDYSLELSHLVTERLRYEKTRVTALRLGCSHTLVAEMHKGLRTIREKTWRAFCQEYAVPWPQVQELLVGRGPDYAGNPIVVSLGPVAIEMRVSVVVPTLLKDCGQTVRLKINAGAGNDTEVAVDPETGEAVVRLVLTPAVIGSEANNSAREEESGVADVDGGERTVKPKRHS